MVNASIAVPVPLGDTSPRGRAHLYIRCAAAVMIATTKGDMNEHVPRSFVHSAFCSGTQRNFVATITR